MRQTLLKAVFALVMIALLGACAYFLPHSSDFNGNGFTDAQDIVIGARMDAVRHPEYDPAYVSTGYPDEDKGVCADVVWRAFCRAGYSLRKTLAADIALRPEAYTSITEPDDTIDFRRVRNLRVLFEGYFMPLTTDISDTDAFLPGDIVIFRDNKHIGIVSDRKNENGLPLLIHNGGQKEREEDYLSSHEPTAHFRFDVSRLPRELRIAWSDGELASD